MQTCTTNSQLREIASPLLGKWVPLIVLAIDAGVSGFLELERVIDGISRKVLAENLKSLEASNIIRKYGEASTGHVVTYELTSLGREYIEVLQPVKQWLHDNADRLRR